MLENKLPCSTEVNEITAHAILVTQRICEGNYSSLRFSTDDVQPYRLRFMMQFTNAELQLVFAGRPIRAINQQKCAVERMCQHAQFPNGQQGRDPKSKTVNQLYVLMINLNKKSIPTKTGTKRRRPCQSCLCGIVAKLPKHFFFHNDILSSY